MSLTRAPEQPPNIGYSPEMPLVQPLPTLRDADLLARLKIMLQLELSAATSKLAAAHLTKEIKELGSRTNDLEEKTDTAATVLENHKQDFYRGCSLAH